MISFPLLRRSLARTAPLLVAVSLLMAGFQLALVLLASSYDRTQSFDRLALLAPSFLQRSLGSGLQTIVSFSGMVTLGYFHPLVMITVVLTAMYLATELAGDVEMGMVDLVLGRSVARHRLVTRTLLHTILSIVFVVGAMWGATTLALHVLAPHGTRGPAPVVLGQLVAYLVAVASCFGALALAAGAYARRRSTALASASLVALSLYLLDLIAPLWQPARLLARVSPFYYFQGISVVTGANDPGRDLSVLAAVTVVCIGLAYRAFAERDL